jgi:erythromycin esterase-like protein
MYVRPALQGSWEDLFHWMGAPAFLLSPPTLDGRRLERAIGVVYLPETERQSHYFQASLADQLDAVVHIDETHAVGPSSARPGGRPASFPKRIPGAV